MSHADLADVKRALADGRVRLLTDIPALDGSRTVIVGVHSKSDGKAAAVPSIAVKISLDADENVKSVSTDKLIHE